MKKTILLLVAVALPAACATAPTKMTESDRKTTATVAVTGNEEAVVELLTDFLLSDGYTIDRYDEATNILSTNWRYDDKGAFYESIAGKFEDKVQAKVRTATDGQTTVEFWIYSKTGNDGREELNMYPAPYEDLVSRFRAYAEANSG